MHNNKNCFRNENEESIGARKLESKKPMLNSRGTFYVLHMYLI